MQLACECRTAGPAGLREMPCYNSRAHNLQGGLMSSVVKKRRKKIRKHKYKKMRKKTRWARMHK
jgi:hypothetical protein